MALLPPAAAFKTLALGAALTSFFPVATLAQSSDGSYDEAQPVIEEVLVVGTRIRRVDVEAAAPVTIIEREMIEKSGYATVSELLRASVYNATGTRRVWSNPPGYGATASVDLRGLGPANTLVLLNGRRLAPLPGGGAESQDLNQIPMDAVERVEILRDGASAIYGSDAIAGVINIITRKDMRGAVVTLELGDRDAPGGESGRGSVTGGYGWDRGNLTYSLEHFRENAVYERDIPRLANRLAFGSFTYSGFPASALVLGGPLQNLLLTDPRCPPNPGESEAFPNAYRWNWYDWEPGSDWLFETFCGYEYAADQSFTPDFERNSLLLDGRQELSDQVRLLARVLYARSEAEHVAAPAALEDFPFFYTANNPHNPLWLHIGQSVTDPGLLAFGIPDGTWHFTEEDLADVYVVMRTVPNGNRVFSSENENSSVYVGLEGEHPWIGGTKWDLGLEWARSRTRDNYHNLVSLPALQEAMDSGLLDLFNVEGLDHDSWLENTESVFASVNRTTYYFGDTDQWTIDGMLSLEGFEWGSGPVPVVVGFEYRNLAYSQGSDPESSAGLIAGWSWGETIESADRQVATAYAETLLPLGSQLDLDLAVRYDHYSDFGSTTNPKLSLAWRPGEDWLLRGTWGTGFKAPNMLELFAPRRREYGFAVDYVGCANGVATCEQWGYIVYAGGNPDLEAHESESWTAGAVWNATDHLALDLTYYEIEYTNQVQSIDLQWMFERERDGLSHTVVRKPDGTVDYVEATLINISGMRTTGIDFSAFYALTTDRSGLFEFTLYGSRVFSAESKWQENEPFINYVDWGSIPKTRADFVANWSRNAFQLTWVTHYIDEHGKGENVCWPGWGQGPCEEGSELWHLDAFWSHDLQLAWTATWNGQFTLGATNLFNEEPPYHDCCVNSAWTLYDPTGRRVYLRYRQEF
jgi:outer membrane receptor protein involved in Fe transport